jgi:hypothetical protein
MRKIAAVLVTAGLVLGAVALASPAGASAPAKTSRQCKAFKNFDLPDLNGTTTKQKSAATAKQLRKIARASSGKTKSAANTLATSFENYADSGDTGDLADAANVKAIGTLSLAALKCITTNITLPDITLPGPPVELAP